MNSPLDGTIEPRSFCCRRSYVAELRWPLSICLVAAVAAAATLAMAWHHGPVPVLHDEFSNLLVADTLRHGRLANPPPEIWQPFQSFHVVVCPTYASKYPLGPGLLLAIGWWLCGTPAAGIWLGAALCCAAITWAAGGCLPRRWAVFAGLLVALNSNVHHEWSLNFMNGWSTATASALVAGALLRLRKGCSKRDAFILGIGIGGLALTRPAEGLIFTAASSCLALWWWRRLRGHERMLRILRVALWSSAPIATALLLIAIQNQMITGKVTTMAYQLHESQYGVAPLNIFQSPRIPEMNEWLKDVPPPIHTYHYGWSLESYLKRNHFLGWCSAVAERLHVVTKLWGWAYCFITALVLISTRGRYWPVASTIGIALLVGSFIPWYFSHYFAPSLVWLVILTAIALRLTIKRYTSDRITMKLAVGCLILLQLIGMASEIGAANRRPNTWADQRQSLLDQLRRSGERHLVLVRYHPKHNVHHEWVYNEADLENSTVLWAHSWRDDLDQRLLDHYRGRKVWLLQLDESDLATVSEMSPATAMPVYTRR